MYFDRIIEMTIKPPFKYFIMPIGHFTIKRDWYCNSLKEAKVKSENLFLNTNIRCSIYNVYYKDGDWETRAGWLSERILTLDSDCSWYKESDSFLIHTSFLVGYDVRNWNPKLYDKIRKGFIDDKLKEEDEWEYVKEFLNFDFEKNNFNLQVKKACEKVERKIEAFLKANEELSILVKTKYPKISAQYAIFDRMVMFYEEDENGKVDKQFQSLKEVEEYYRSKSE